MTFVGAIFMGKPGILASNLESAVKLKLSVHTSLGDKLQMLFLCLSPC